MNARCAAVIDFILSFSPFFCGAIIEAAKLTTKHRYFYFAAMVFMLDLVTLFLRIFANGGRPTSSALALRSTQMKRLVIGWSWVGRVSQRTSLVNEESM